MHFCVCTKAHKSYLSYLQNAVWTDGSCVQVYMHMYHVNVHVYGMYTYIRCMFVKAHKSYLCAKCRDNETCSAYKCTYTHIHT